MTVEACSVADEEVGVGSRNQERADRQLLGCHDRRIVAGMDGNRTHPGRLNSAPQTVLKTAGPFASVNYRPPEFQPCVVESAIICRHPLPFAQLAVSLAVRTSAPFGRTVPNRPNAVSSLVLWYPQR